MKKMTKWAAGAAAALILAAYGGVSVLGASAVTADEAREIALSHAGVEASQVQRIRVHEDHEQGRAVYEVEFNSGNEEYDYEIDKESGHITKYDHDTKYRRGYGAAAPAAAPSMITLEDARQQALARVPGADEGNIRIRPDRDHGRLTYEGKILYKGVEYEFEIDAATGEFTDWSEEY